jgi:hypothetical protein
MGLPRGPGRGELLPVPIHIRVQAGQVRRVTVPRAHMGSVRGGDLVSSHPGGRASGVILSPGVVSPSRLRRARRSAGHGPRLRPRVPLRPVLSAGIPGPGDQVGVQPAAGSLSRESRASRPLSPCGIFVVGGIRVGLFCRKRLVALRVGSRALSSSDRVPRPASESVQRPTSYQPQVPKPPQ